MTESRTFSMSSRNPIIPPYQSFADMSAAKMKPKSVPRLNTMNMIMRNIILIILSYEYPVFPSLDGLVLYLHVKMLLDLL